MYDKTLCRHTFSLLLGQSAKKSSGPHLGSNRFNIAYIAASNGLQENGDRGVYGGPNAFATLVSLFARASYNFDKRYMF